MSETMLKLNYNTYYTYIKSVSNTSQIMSYFDILFIHFWVYKLDLEGDSNLTISRGLTIICITIALYFIINTFIL